MANSQTDLPEGTDSIILGASAESAMRDSAGFPGDNDFGSADGALPFAQGSGSTELGSTGSSPADQISETAAKVSDATTSLRAQATDKAFGYAAQGRDRAVGLLDNVTRLVDDAAGQIDERAGEQYGAYARQASQAVAGFADTLRNKDVEELFDDARGLVRKSPTIAIGAAAAIGFLVARVLKVGLSEASHTGSGKVETALSGKDGVASAPYSPMSSVDPVGPIESVL